MEGLTDTALEGAAQKATGKRELALTLQSPLKALHDLQRKTENKTRVIAAMIQPHAIAEFGGTVDGDGNISWNGKAPKRAEVRGYVLELVKLALPGLDSAGHRDLTTCINKSLCGKRMLDLDPDEGTADDPEVVLAKALAGYCEAKRIELTAEAIEDAIRSVTGNKILEILMKD